MFRDLARMFTASGPVNWEVARQFAVWTATNGQAETNVEPLRRMRLEELFRIADLHVAEVSGLTTAASGKVPQVRAVGRAEWAVATLDAYRPLLERLATSLVDVTGAEPDAVEPDPTTALLGNLTQVMGPVMFGMQGGFTIGHLAQRAFGQYGLPIPRANPDELLVVPATIDAFASDWSLSADDVSLWVALSELTHHAVLARPHVRGRFEQLLLEYVGGFEPDPGALEGKLGELDPANPAGIQEVLGDPEALLGAMQTDAQRQTLVQLEALVCVIEGYVDHVVDVAGRKLVSAFPSLTEALRRRRVERGDSDKFVERLFGLDIDQSRYDRGTAFIRGVLERAGDDGLSRLWRSEHELPTPPEVDAPGLWLERIDLPDD